jgi:hypothetical protein
MGCRTIVSFCFPPTIVKAEAGSLCDRNSQGQRERKRKRIRVCATNWRYQIALPFIPPLISLPFMRKECTAGLLAHVRCRQFFFFLFLNPWTYIRSLLPRQLVSSDCVLLQGRVRKKEIDRLHYRLLCQNEPRSLVFEQTKHLGQVYKSVVAIYDHSTRIFSFPPFFSLFFCLTFNPVWARRSLLLLQSDQWTSVHHVEIRYPLKMSVRWSLAPHDGQRLEKLYIEMSFSTVNAARGERINRPDWKWSESLITISTSPCMRFTTYLFIGYSR